MAGPALTAHVFVACRTAQWDGPPGPNTSRTLEQVSYSYGPETPDGFPYETELWLFARLAHAGRREFTRDLQLSLVWRDDPNFRRELWDRRFQIATFRPGVWVRDVAVPVPVVFEEPGEYVFRLWYPVTRKWDQARRRRVIANAYIRIRG